jgi:hypothetical protein
MIGIARSCCVELATRYGGRQRAKNNSKGPNLNKIIVSTITGA